MVSKFTFSSPLIFFILKFYGELLGIAENWLFFFSDDGMKLLADSCLLGVPGETTMKGVLVRTYPESWSESLILNFMGVSTSTDVT